MSIGKYCQLCGERKRVSEVIGEAHGIVVTAPCLMTRVYGDPAADPDEVRAGLKFCALCGAEQDVPGAGHCKACGAPLDAATGEADLAKSGSAANLRKRSIAFAIDIIIIAALWAVVFIAVNGFENSWNQAGALTEVSTITESDVLGESGEVNFFSVMRYASLLLIFVLYHALGGWLIGATPGKLTMGIRVMLKNGSPKLGFGRSLMRSGLYLFALYVIPIGLLPLIFQEPPSKWLGIIERDAMFHNSLTDTVVIEPGR